MTDHSSLDGVIRTGELYRWSVACVRLHWGRRAQEQAIRKGLKLIRFARQRYVFGQEILRFFEELEKQSRSER